MTVTDANLFLGRLVPDYFPHIFGETEDLPLDAQITRDKFEELKADVNSSLAPGARKLTAEEVALGFLRVADEAMSRPIRSLTEARGHDAAAHDLAVFGGAGGQHACSIATALGISRVIMHRYSSILSAYGMALADLVAEVQAPLACVFSQENLTHVQSVATELLVKAKEELESQGLDSSSTVTYELFLHMHYEGSDTLIMIAQDGHEWNFAERFIERHRQEFGFTMPREVHLGDVRVRAVGNNKMSNAAAFSSKAMAAMNLREAPKDLVQMWNNVYFDGLCWQKTPVYLLHTLQPGHQIHGPAMVIDKTQTIVITPNAIATTLQEHIVIDIDNAKSAKMTQNAPTLDPVQLSVFGHRFMGIAEQMGRTLQKTSVSTNIKERLDFSCALFSADGKLVANGMVFFVAPG